MVETFKQCKRCGTVLTSDNWDDVWKSINVKICDRCKNVWVKKSLRDDVASTRNDKPYAQQHPDRKAVTLRDEKFHRLAGVCSRCYEKSSATVRHHLWYPVNEYDPDSIVELCQLCHNVVHSVHGSMPIIR